MYMSSFLIRVGEKYEDRGIIPRTISALFEEFESRPHIVMLCICAYEEILYI